jgi:hypothetical protein
MKQSIITFFWFALGVFALFALLDLFNLTAWFIFPVSCATKKNKTLCSVMGNTPAIIGTATNS